MFTEEQKHSIIREYYQTLSRVRCPEDNAFVEIHDDWRMGPSLEVRVFCPLCKQRFEVERKESGPKWTSDQLQIFVIAELRGQSSGCPNCGSVIEVNREPGGYGDKYTYSVKCRYCLLHEDIDF